MKNCLLTLLASFLLLSCEEIQNPDVSGMPQEWYLIGYKGGWTSQEDITPIKDTIYHYRLEADGSFVKTIGQYQLAGTYDFEDFEGKTYVTLNFDEASIQLHEEKYLIHYCGQHHEYFNVLDSKTVVGSWGQCDGPNFYFRRK